MCFGMFGLCVESCVCVFSVCVCMLFGWWFCYMLCFQLVDFWVPFSPKWGLFFDCKNCFLTLQRGMNTVVGVGRPLAGKMLFAGRKIVNARDSWAIWLVSNTSRILEGIRLEAIQACSAWSAEAQHDLRDVSLRSWLLFLFVFGEEIVETTGGTLGRFGARNARYRIYEVEKEGDDIWFDRQNWIWDRVSNICQLKKRTRLQAGGLLICDRFGIDFK